MNARDPAVTSEATRLQALQALDVLDSGHEPVFDALVAAAAQICGTPIALISLVDAERQWFKANLGLAGVVETPRSVAFCDHAIRDAKVLEVPDATADPRFATNPLVEGDPNIRFYAGAPIELAGGERIGTVCVIDRTARHLDDSQRAALAHLASVAAHSLVERRRRVAAARELAASEQRYRAIVEDQVELISIAEFDGTLRFVNAAYARHHGLPADELIGRNLLEFVPEAERDGVRLHLTAVRDAQGTSNGVNSIVGADGHTRWIAWSNRCLRDEDGEPSALQSVGRDVTDQHLAEQALAASRQRVQRLYEATPLMLHSIDAGGRLVAVSDAWLAELGYERAEVIGRLSSDFLAPESRRRARDEVLPAFFRDGRCDRVEYQMLRRDGSLVEVELSAVLERDTEGVPVQSLAVLQNVSARKRLAAELGQTHAHLDAVVNNVPAMLGYWDDRGVTRFANREFQAAVGVPMRSIVGHGLRELWFQVDADSWPAMVEHVDAVLAGQRREFELAMLTTSGLRQLRATLVPDRPDPKQPGRVAGFYGLWYDITGRKSLELRLTDSEQRFRSLFEHLNSGFALHELVVDASGKPVDYKYLAMNQAFSTITGIEPARALGKRVTELLPGTATDPADWIGTFGQVVLSGKPVHMEQRSVELGRWFDVVAYRPAPGQFAVIAQDVTRRKEAEQRIELALAEKETLLKEVYHRVKNNLQVVQSLLGLQQRSLADPAAQAALDETVQRVRAMALVHEKLYQSGNLSMVTLDEYTADLLQQIGTAADALRRRIELVGEIEPLKTGLDNAIPFGLLVTELVSNAFKHAFRERERGTVRVRLVRDGDGARLSVEDDGVGLPAGFDLDRPTSMGLQLAASLARQLGGELEAENRSGAMFSVMLARL